MCLLSRQQAISGGCTWSHFSVCNFFTASYICAGWEQLKSFPLTFKQYFSHMCEELLQMLPFFNFDTRAWLVRFPSWGTIPLSPLAEKLRVEAETCSKMSVLNVVLLYSSPTTQNTPSSGENTNRMTLSPVNSFNGNLGFRNLCEEALTCRSPGRASNPQPLLHLSLSRPMQGIRNPAEMAQMSWCAFKLVHFAGLWSRPAGSGTHVLISLPPHWPARQDGCFPPIRSISHPHFHIADGFVLAPVPWLLLSLHSKFHISVFMFPFGFALILSSGTSMDSSSWVALLFLPSVSILLQVFCLLKRF